MEHAAVIPLGSQGEPRVHFLDHGSADVSWRMASEVGMNRSTICDKELAVEVLRLDGSACLDGEIMASPFFCWLHHFAQHRVANDRRHDGLEGNGAVVKVDVADHGGDDVAVSKGGPFKCSCSPSLAMMLGGRGSPSCFSFLSQAWPEVGRTPFAEWMRGSPLNPPYGSFIGFLRESCVPLSVKPPALDVRRSGSFRMVLVDGWKAEFGSQHGFGFPSV